MRDYYSEIDKSLKSYEDYKPYHINSLDWISDRICWCWKWKKITEEQKNELAERVIKIFEERK